MTNVVWVFVIQFLVLLITYPLWVKRRNPIKLSRWVLFAITASIATCLILLVLCYRGYCLD
jgi:hypothetical protein